MKIEIYTPPLCCASGLCGPDVDEELMDFNDLVLKLKEKGLQVERYLLNQQPNKFMEQKKIASLLQNEGADALPATVIDGEVIKKNNYPSLEDIEKFVNPEEFENADV